MKRADFLTFCQLYYGEKYDGIRGEVMSEYLDGKPEPFFDAAANVLTRRFSRTNRIAPGPAEIEKYLHEIHDLMPQVRPLPAESRGISTKEQELVKEKIHWLLNKLSIGVRQICPNCRKPFMARINQEYCPDCRRARSSNEEEATP